MGSVLPYVAVLAFLALLGIGAWYLRRVLAHRALARSLGYELLLVRVAREDAKQGEDLKAQTARAEQLFAGLLALKRPVSYEVAVPHVGEEIHFYVSVPRDLAETVLRQVQALWPSASVTREQGDYNVFSPGGAVAAAYVTAKDAHAMPVRSYQELGTDTTAAIFGGFTKLAGVGQGAAMQVVAYPAPADDKKRLMKLLEGLRTGRTLKDLAPSSVPGLGAVTDALSGKPAPLTSPQSVDEELARALESKISKPLVRANIRLIASAPTQREADTILEGIAAGFSQFTAPRRNELRVTRPRSLKRIIHEFSYREFSFGNASLLGVEELASLYHFPLPGSELSRVKWLKSREAAPPAELPKEGLLIGESVYRGTRTPVYLGEDDRRRHIYVIGQTGVGKSTLLGNLILDDIARGAGVCVIDPHGELVETALAHVPPSRIDDVVYFDPGDLQLPLGLNMLDFDPSKPEEKTFIVNEVQGIFNKLFPPETMGPMFEQYMRNALLLLMEDAVNEPATFVEVPRVFTDAEWRKKKLARITNPVVVDFWTQEAAKAGGDASLQNMTPYITSKFSNFIANDYIRPIIGQPKSSFNFRDVMDNGKILLVNVSKGKIGDINANLLGMIVVGKLLMAAFARAGSDKESRRDFHVYVDEFQNFTTDSVSTIFSEARKYRLTMTVAHQFIAQLSDKIRDSIFGNVGNQLAMRVGPTDAEFLVKQFEPVFSESDLVNIDNLNAYAKIMVRGETSRPFNIEVGRQSWAKGDPDYTAKLKEYARIKFGTPRHTVEAEITKRLRN